MTDIINQSTGIHIDRRDIALKASRKELNISAWGCTLARVRLPEEKPASFVNLILNKVTTDTKKLRAKIIRCKINHLSESLPQWEHEIKQSLAQQNVSSTFVNSLIFNIVDHGYKFRNFVHQSEAHYDYPFIALKIHNSEDFDFSFPINVYDIVDPVDIEYLKHRLFIAILEKNLHNGKHLKDL